MNARIFLPLLASTCFISNGYCSELFGKASTDINNAQSELIKELKESSSTINVSIFDLSLAKENLNSDTLTLKTTENTQVIYHKKSLTTSNGSSVWIGFKDKNNTSDLANNIVLVNHNGSIAASFRVNGQLFQVYPLKENKVVVIKVDESKVPSDSEINENIENKAVTCPTYPSYSGDSGKKSNIRVAIVTTKQSRDRLSSSDISALTTLAFTEANLGVSNSDVGINFVLAGILDADYTETGNYSNNLSQMKTSSGSSLSSQLNDFRVKNKASLAVMLLGTSGEAGTAYNDATASTAFAVIRYSYLTGTYTFAHEMGHNIGASHDLAQYDNNQPKRLPCYRHGFKHEDSSAINSWRTIMSYNCSNVSCSRINMFSNPRMSYKGIPSGSEKYEDNSRRLNERRETVASFY